MKDWAARAFFSLLAVFAPAKAVMVTVGFLIFADLVTGVWAAIKRGETIRSSKLRHTISKFIIYQIAVISAFAIEEHILKGVIPVMQIVGGMIAITELLSILENGNTIVGGNIFRMIISKLGSENAKLAEVKNESNSDKG